MVIAGKMMWKEMVKPNWLRANSSAVSPNMQALLPPPRTGPDGFDTANFGRL